MPNRFPHISRHLALDSPKAAANFLQDWQGLLRSVRNSRALTLLGFPLLQLAGSPGRAAGKVDGLAIRPATASWMEM